ncbi:MAG: hypothetical protein APF80_09905 [Alphaproteobacteria bacterium BRH_c36]|nr:MAG: hypothetical protein APF80_09905 [Alphaproteobacteria bacterium BRH_c36]
MKQNMEPMVFGLLGENPVREPLHYRACGLDNVYLCSGFIQEEVDGEMYTSVTGVNDLYIMIAFRLSLLRRALAGMELRFLRKYLDLTQQELADQFGLTRKTVNAYECDREPAPWANQRLLQVTVLSQLMKHLRKLVEEGDMHLYERFHPELEDLIDYLLHTTRVLDAAKDAEERRLIGSATIGHWKMQTDQCCSA